MRILFTILAILLLASFTFAVDPTSTGISDVDNIPEGFERGVQKMAVTPNGDIYILFGTENQAALLRSTDGGATWTEVVNPVFLAGGYQEGTSLWNVHDDTLYAVENEDEIYLRIAKLWQTSRTVLDTIDNEQDNPSGAYGVPNLNQGDSLVIMVWHDGGYRLGFVENGRIEQDVNTFWTNIGDSVSHAGPAIGFPLWYGSAAWALGDNDLFWTRGGTAPTTPVFTVTTTAMPSVQSNQHENQCVIPHSVTDSVFYVAVENSSDQVIFYRFVINAVDSSLTNPSGAVTVSSTNLVAGDNVDIRRDPCLGRMGDSLIIIYKNYPSGAGDPDHIDVVYRISTDSGTTWGSEIILYDGIGDDTLRNMQCPPIFYNDLLIVAYTDAGATTHNLWVLKETLTPAETDNTPPNWNTLTTNFLAEDVLDLSPLTGYFTVPYTDSADADTVHCIVKSGSVPLSKSDGVEVFGWRAADMNNADTSFSKAFTFTGPAWAWFAVWIGDDEATINWSDSLVDSMYIPEGGAAAGRTNRMAEALRQYQFGDF